MESVSQEGLCTDVEGLCSDVESLSEEGRGTDVESVPEEGLCTDVQSVSEGLCSDVESLSEEGQGTLLATSRRSRPRKERSHQQRRTRPTTVQELLQRLGLQVNAELYLRMLTVWMCAAAMNE